MSGDLPSFFPTRRLPSQPNLEQLRKQAGESARDHVKRLTPILFDPNFEPMVAMPVLPHKVSRVETISTRNGDGI